MTPQVQSFFDPATWTISHIIHNGVGSACAIVDSVLDYDPKSGRTRFDSADKLIQFIQDHDLKTEWILETHAHADHLSASAYLKKTVGGRIAMGEHIQMVQRAFKKIFNLKEDEFKTDGSQFDVLFKDNEQFQIGDLTARVMFVPGHTPGCASYIVGDAVFVGDTIFMPDVGTARCDFPGGDAQQLHQSIQRLLSMPDDTKLYLCHDYPPNGRKPIVHTTVAAERAENIHVHDGISATEFVEMRTARDANLAMPNLILPAIQVNIRAGELPKAEDNGTHYLKIPLNVLG